MKLVAIENKGIYEPYTYFNKIMCVLVYTIDYFYVFMPFFSFDWYLVISLFCLNKYSEQLSCFIIHQLRDLLPSVLDIFTV